MTVDVLPIVVPELYFPIPSAISPHAETLNAYVATWMERNALYSTPGQLARYVKSSFGTFAARVCPEADLDRLKLFAEWLAFGFFYDDQFFDEDGGNGGPHTSAAAAIAAISAFIPTGVLVALPRLADGDRTHRLNVLADLVKRTSTVARPEQFQRFCTQMTIWFYSYLYEPAMRAGGASPTTSEYAVNRLYNIATAPYVTLAEIAAGCRATSEDLAADQVRTLSSTAAYEMAWCNDIHSAGREAAVNPLIENLTSILQRESRSAREAMDEAVEIHNSTLRSYLDLEALVLPTATPEVRHYLAVLRTWMRGHYDWCRETLRYST
ncbi:hypothetical protein ACGFYV_34525 [Streptomyces sp. NPDC048297]|uniref:terpene synthase family protein n=1 Tax=Streptomyces sp. NPDC048297 TaxID=3365531 RepID=UPI00371B115D